METTQDLIRRYNILANRFEAYTSRTPIREQVRTTEEVKRVLNELKKRGLYHAGGRQFVTVPQE